MRISVQKWGNSLAVRIPKAIAQESGIDSGTSVDLQLVKGNIVLKPQPKPRYSLDDLLAGVNDSNRHDEIQTGPALGREAW
jgi:antitoxin MazE